MIPFEYPPVDLRGDPFDLMSCNDKPNPPECFEINAQSVIVS